MKAESFGIDCLRFDLEFPCWIHFGRPMARILDREAFQVLIDAATYLDSLGLNEQQIAVKRFDLILTRNQSLLRYPNVALMHWDGDLTELETPLEGPPEAKRLGIAFAIDAKKNVHERSALLQEEIILRSNQFGILVYTRGEGGWSSNQTSAKLSEWTHQILLDPAPLRSAVSRRFLSCVSTITIPICNDSANIEPYFPGSCLQFESLDRLDAIRSAVNREEYIGRLTKLIELQRVAIKYLNPLERIKRLIVQFRSEMLRGFVEPKRVEWYRSLDRSAKFAVPVSHSVYYINLAHRTDRRLEIEGELRAVFENLERVEAVNGATLGNIDATISGSLGCSLSHLEALRRGKASGAELIFIFEDDFCWEIPILEVKEKLERLAKTDFNVIALSYHLPAVKISAVAHGDLGLACEIQTTAGYVVRRDFLDNLVGNLHDGIKHLLATGDKGRFSCDQHWKALQSACGETKFFASIPRLGAQRHGQSDITNREEAYGGSCFVAIVSCQKYLARHTPESYRDCPFPYRVFVGGAVGETDDGSLVRLDCDDSYERLPEKVRRVFSWVVAHYPNIGYILKTDDDVRHDFGMILRVFSTISGNRIDYAGNIVDVGDSASVYHIDKVSESKYKSAVVLEALRYCSGGGYFLSRRSVNIITQSPEFPKNIFEDYSVGFELNAKGLAAVGFPIYGHSSFW